MPTAISARATCIPRHTCGPLPNASAGFGGRVMSYSSGRSQRAGSRLAAPRQRWSTEPCGRCAPKNSVSRVTWRENIGSVGAHRSDSSMAGRTNAAVVAHRGEDLGPLEDRGQRDAHLLPRRTGAGGEQQHRERVDLGVGEAVHDAVLVGVLGLHQHADEVVGRLHAPRRDDRLQDVEDPLRVAHEELADHQRLLDAHPEAPGDGEHRDGGGEVDVELGMPVVRRSCR